MLYCYFRIAFKLNKTLKSMRAELGMPINEKNGLIAKDLHYFECKIQRTEQKLEK